MQGVRHFEIYVRVQNLTEKQVLSIIRFRYANYNKRALAWAERNVI